MNFALAAAMATFTGAALFVTPASGQSDFVLSQKPTFACEIARTSIDRIICLEPSGPTRDWDLSAATWARLFSYDEIWRDAFLQQHKQWVQSLYPSCFLWPDQASWLPYQRDCVLGAYQTRARLYRSQLSGDAFIESQMLPEQRAELQGALVKLGFLEGEADGQFGPVTRNAIRSFQETNGFSPSEFLTERQRSALVIQARSAQNAPGGNSPQPHEKKPEPKTLAGTGFFVSEDGQVLTNAHVVEGCSTVTIRAGNEQSFTGNVVARDTQNDLALIRTGLQSSMRASLRANARFGEPVAAFGYPLPGILSQSGNFTHGHISGMAGLFDNTRYFQVSTPIQPGSSGGPLVDNSGNVVGVVTGKLDAIKMAPLTRDLAQNVNFAMKAEMAMSFLASNNISYSTGSPGDQLKTEVLAERARRISVALSCSPPLSARQY